MVHLLKRLNPTSRLLRNTSGLGFVSALEKTGQIGHTGVPFMPRFARTESALCATCCKRAALSQFNQVPSVLLITCQIVLLARILLKVVELLVIRMV